MSDAATTLVIRADAGHGIGVGHLMRCIALGQAWQDQGGQVVFACYELADELRTRITTEGFRVTSIFSEPGSHGDAEETAEMMARCKATQLVIDGYHFNREYHRWFCTIGTRVTLIDDYGTARDAEIIVNQNAYAVAGDYRETQARLCIGGRYAMLRREFRTNRNAAPPHKNRLERVLVSCGGSDPHNATERIVTAVAGCDQDCELIVVAGSMSRRAESIRHLLDSLSVRFQLHDNVHDMSALMREVDVAVVAAGSTCWELASLGVPILAVVTAENQVRVAETVEHHGIGWSLGWADEISKDRFQTLFKRIRGEPDLLAQASAAGRHLIDGLGAVRVARAIASPQVMLRPACVDDCRRLWFWRNDETVRMASFTTDEVPWEDHCQWFKDRLTRSDCWICIGQNTQGEPIGQIRIDFERNRAVISIGLASEYRGAGYGTALIRAATDLVFRETAVSRLEAYARAENRASVSAFRNAGFHLQAVEQEAKHQTVQLTMVRPVSSQTGDSFYHAAG